MALGVSIVPYLVVAFTTGPHSVPTFIALAIVACVFDVVLAVLSLAALRETPPARRLRVWLALGALGAVTVEGSSLVQVRVNHPLLAVAQSLGSLICVVSIFVFSIGARMLSTSSRASGAGDTREAEGGEGGVADGIVRRTPPAPPRFRGFGARRHQQPPNDS